VEREFKLNNFDAIRIFASVQVMILHVLTHLKIDYPWWFLVIKPFSGVPMFFVISGFLISASYERSPNLKQYFRNRALRIYPGLWCCILLTILTILIFSDISFLRGETIPWLLSQMAGVIYTPGFLKGYGIGAYHVSLWTIPIELQFYIILPILFLLIWFVTKDRIITNRYFLALFIFFTMLAFALYSFKLVFTPAVELVETTTQKLLRYSFIPHVYMFLFGVVIQRYKLYQSKWLYGKGVWWCIVFLLFAYAGNAYPNFWLFTGANPASQINTKIAMLLLCVTTISLAYTKPGFAHKLLHNNDISYGVYIYHGMVLNVFIVLGLTSGYSYFVLICLITMILAYLSWILIERPFIRKKKVTLKSDVQVTRTM
jgi:peptidoglycan/LPS O-acetylase OafA/YrhL